MSISKFPMHVSFQWKHITQATSCTLHLLIWTKQIYCFGFKIGKIKCKLCGAIHSNVDKKKPWPVISITQHREYSTKRWVSKIITGNLSRNFTQSFGPMELVRLSGFQVVVIFHFCTCTLNSNISLKLLLFLDIN